MEKETSFYDNLEDRKKKELEHHNIHREIVTGYEYDTDAYGKSEDERRKYVTDQKEYEYHFSNAKFYSITNSSFAYRDKILFKDMKNKVALDWCCGNGEIGLAMAQAGAKKVCGVDLSDVSIDNATKLAKENNVGEKCNYLQMDAENMTYPDNTFDVVHEYGALHHVDLEVSLKEVSRVLKSQGSFICTEALRHNPLIHAYRKRSMHLRTEWEVDHILGAQDILKGKKYFYNVKIKYFHLFALAAIPFRKTFIFKPLLSVLELLDNIFLKIPFVQRMAWIAVIEYSKPKL